MRQNTPWIKKKDNIKMAVIYAVMNRGDSSNLIEQPLTD